MKSKTIKPVVLPILEKACKGTPVTTRELIKELTPDDLAAIKNGEMSAVDLRELVLELADNIDNATLYRIKVKNSEPNNTPDNLF